MRKSDIIHILVAVAESRGIDFVEESSAVDGLRQYAVIACFHVFIGLVDDRLCFFFVFVRYKNDQKAVLSGIIFRRREIESAIIIGSEAIVEIVELSLIEFPLFVIVAGSGKYVFIRQKIPGSLRDLDDSKDDSDEKDNQCDQ